MRELTIDLLLTLDSYLGASFDVPSLVERLLEQLASKQKIVVRLYDITNHTYPTKMYDSDVIASDDLHISNIDFGDPTRKHVMHCRYFFHCAWDYTFVLENKLTQSIFIFFVRFKHAPSLPWSAIMISSAVAIIVLLVGYIIYATLNSLEEAEDNYTTMRDLKGRAEAADVAKSQVLLSLAVFLSFAMFL